jgi:tetratricopeptide (TPR) repeat protein
VDLPPPNVCRRIRGLFNLTGSPNDDEAKSARATLIRILAEHGLSWNDLPRLLPAIETALAAADEAAKGNREEARRKRQADRKPQRGEDVRATVTLPVEVAKYGGSARVVLPTGRAIEVKVPAGVKDGAQLRLRGLGAPGLDGGEPGDVLVSIEIEPPRPLAVQRQAKSGLAGAIGIICCAVGLMFFFVLGSYLASYDRAVGAHDDPKQAGYYRIGGNIHFSNKEYDQAIGDYGIAIALDPKDATAYSSRAYAYYMKKDYDRAIGDFGHAIALNPKDATAYSSRGFVYHVKKDYDRAITDYDQAIALDPKFALAYSSRGNVYYDNKDYDQAISDYSLAIALDPKDAVGYSNRGDAYYMKKDYDRAIADYDQAVALDPKNAVALDPKNALAYINRGLADRKQGDYDRAIADYDQAIKLDPKYAAAYANRGNAYDDKGDYDRAIADHNQAIQLDPKNALAYNNRGFAFGNKGDYDRAIADYNQAIHLDPKYALVYINRGVAKLYLGALPGALEDFATASDLAPGNAYAALWYDIVKKRSNLPSQLGEAIPHLDMTKWPAPIVRLFLGQLTPEAVLAAADSPDPTTKNRQFCEANFFSGELELQRGDKRQATKLFQFATVNCPKWWVEFGAAQAELKTLGVNP